MIRATAAARIAPIVALAAAADGAQAQASTRLAVVSLASKRRSRLRR